MLYNQKDANKRIWTLLWPIKINFAVKRLILNIYIPLESMYSQLDALLFEG